MKFNIYINSYAGVIIMVESWVLELLKGIGKVFLNPLLYWSFLMILIVSYRRIQRERGHFGFKIFNAFSEWKNTWMTSILAGLIISLLTLGLGMVFSYETILVLSIVVIILSISFSLTLLSASYTIGITYLIILLSPLLLQFQTFLDVQLFSKIDFTSLVILLSIFLFIEAILLRNIKREDTFPELSLSDRGIWIGQHHLKKISMIPFFVLIPSGMITPFAPFWPYFSIGDESYSILLVPFIIGFDYLVRGSLPQNAARRISKSVSILGLIVLLLAIGSIYISWLSLIAVLIAIVGREFINYKHRINDKGSLPYFNPVAAGLKVLAVIPSTPGDRLGILVGETILKVNGQEINSVEEFYIALQESGAYFKIDVLNDEEEVRFVQSALYEGDHHELGLIFAGKPYRK